MTASLTANLQRRTSQRARQVRAPALREIWVEGKGRSVEDAVHIAHANPSFVKSWPPSRGHCGTWKWHRFMYCHFLIYQTFITRRSSLPLLLSCARPSFKKFFFVKMKTNGAANGVYRQAVALLVNYCLFVACKADWFVRCSRKQISAVAYANGRLHCLLSTQSPPFLSLTLLSNVFLF